VKLPAGFGAFLNELSFRSGTGGAAAGLLVTVMVRAVVSGDGLSARGCSFSWLSCCQQFQND